MYLLDCKQVDNGVYFVCRYGLQGLNCVLKDLLFGWLIVLLVSSDVA